MTAGPFADDIAFLKQHTSLVLLTGEGGAQVAVSPAYQGRVMTSTTGGDERRASGGSDARPSRPGHISRT